MATYYVTQAGSGLGNGTTYANSMSRATANGNTWAADDIVYYCDTFTNQYINVHNGGTSGHNVVFRGDYTGHPCVINNTTENSGIRCAYSYVSIINFGDIKNAVLNGISANPAIIEGLVIQGCTITNCGVYGITFEGGATISGNIIHDCGNGGIRGANVTNAEITTNTVYTIGSAVAGMHIGISVGSVSAGGVVQIHHNTIYDINAPDDTLCTGLDTALVGGSDTATFYIYNNVISDCWNATSDMGYGLQGGDNTVAGTWYIYNNYIYNCYWGLTIREVGTLYIYNNTIVSPGYSAFEWKEAGTKNVTLRNNICVGFEHIFNIDIAGLTLTADHNLYYGYTSNFALIDSVAHTLVQWQGHGYDIDALNDNPLLSGYILQACSPCIRVGMTIEDVMHDIDGRKRPGRPGNSYSIGCWEYLGTNDPDHDENCRLPYR